MFNHLSDMREEGFPGWNVGSRDGSTSNSSQGAVEPPFGNSLAETTATNGQGRITAQTPASNCFEAPSPWEVPFWDGIDMRPRSSREPSFSPIRDSKYDVSSTQLATTLDPVGTEQTDVIETVQNFSYPVGVLLQHPQPERPLPGAMHACLSIQHQKESVNLLDPLLVTEVEVEGEYYGEPLKRTLENPSPPLPLSSERAPRATSPHTSERYTSMSPSTPDFDSMFPDPLSPISVKSVTTTEKPRSTAQSMQYVGEGDTEAPPVIHAAAMSRRRRRRSTSSSTFRKSMETESKRGKYE